MKSQIFYLTLSYILELANNKKYDIQMIGILNKYEETNFDPFIFMENFEEFQKESDVFLCKDFVYKNDFSTFRKYYIASPDLYLYYTYQVFIIYLSIFQEEKPFNHSNLKVFYSGKIEKNFDTITLKNNSSFNNEYQTFKEESKKFKGNSVLAIDIQNFFGSINLGKLFIKIERLLNGNTIGLEALRNLEKIIKLFNITELPQMHFSVASSALSQIYLMDLSEEMNKILVENNWESVRFVDDFYINLKEKNSYKYINKFLNDISKTLFKDELNLNASKTKRLSPDEFRGHINSMKDSYENYETYLQKVSFDVPIDVSKKLDELLDEDGERLFLFFSKMNELYNQNGIDFKEYKKLQNEFFSINNEDASKVIKHLIFSRKWERLNKVKLKNILTNIEMMYFDPINFTILYVFLMDYLKEDRKKSFLIDLENFYNSPIRLLIIYEQLIAQKKIDKIEYEMIKSKFFEIDHNSHTFFERYIFK